MPEETAINTRKTLTFSMPYLFKGQNMPFIFYVPPITLPKNLVQLRHHSDITQGMDLYPVTGSQWCQARPGLLFSLSITYLKWRRPLQREGTTIWGWQWHWYGWWEKWAHQSQEFWTSLAACAPSPCHLPITWSVVTKAWLLGKQNSPTSTYINLKYINLNLDRK